MTPKQQRFVQEYLIDLNGAQAAIRAGYASSGARTEGARLLADADIAAAISERMSERSDKTAIDAAWVLREAADVYKAAREADRLPEALRALELVGKHVDVEAFRNQVDHHHSMTIQEARSVIATHLPKFGGTLIDAPGHTKPSG